MHLPLGLSHFLSIVTPVVFHRSDSAWCPTISYPGVQVGTVTDPQINEASGLVASRTNPGVFWTLNDSQGPVCIYAITTNGTLIKKICLEGAENFDWEAIATAPCDPKVPNVMCLYIGDIGDNSYVRDHISIYRLEEPNLETDLTSEDTSKWQVFHFKYPNDQSFNAESLLIDAAYREVVIVTKSQRPPYSLVFKAPLDIQSGSTEQLAFTNISLPLYDATDATTSADGQVVMIRLYVGAFLWPRRTTRGAGNNDSIVDILREKECLVSVGMQTQGESVALRPSGNAYFTHSEFVNEPIYRYDINA